MFAFIIRMMLFEFLVFYLSVVYAYLLFNFQGAYIASIGLFVEDVASHDRLIPLQVSPPLIANLNWLVSDREYYRGSFGDQDASMSPTLSLPLVCLSDSSAGQIPAMSTILSFHLPTLLMQSEQSTSMSTPSSCTRATFALRSGPVGYDADHGSTAGVPPLSACLPLPLTLFRMYSADDVCLLVRTIKLYLQRYCCRRHDFLNYLRALYRCEPCCPVNLCATLLKAPPFKWIYALLHRLSPLLKYIPYSAPSLVPIKISDRIEFMGGGGPASHTIKGSFLLPHILTGYNMDGHHDTDFRFVQYATLVEAAALCDQDSTIHSFNMPLGDLSQWLTCEDLRNMARLHKIGFASKDRKPALCALLVDHKCDVCDLYVSLFRSCDVLSSVHKRKSDHHSSKSRRSDSILDDRIRSPRSLKGWIPSSYCIDDQDSDQPEYLKCQFVRYAPLQEALNFCDNDDFIPLRLPIEYLTDWLTKNQLRKIASLHDIQFRQKDNKDVLRGLFLDHDCPVCDQYASIVELCDKKTDPVIDSGCRKTPCEAPAVFPPHPPLSPQLEQIVNDFCADTSPSSFEESGCTSCGRLALRTELSPLRDCGVDLSVLISVGVSRKERMSSAVPVQEVDGPVIDESCENVCQTCLGSLKIGKVPKHALANGLWLGPVPDVLKNLTFAEKMMIARVRHNRAVVRVSSGRAKMTANVIMFSNPTLTVYRMLPPCRDEMSEVLACIFTGSAQPTEEDFKRTPFLVRRDKVSKALDWLKLNHCDYDDLEISEENLNSYPLSGVPVVVDYKKTNPDESNKLPAAMSTHDMEDEEGTKEGICPFTVHGITGDEYTKLSMTQLKARALKHLHDQGKVLGIGHDDKPQSMYDNPQAYPQMFPWLFPYGFGGIGQARLKKKISEAEHKKHLLMYHDKRFQTDLYFPIVAFNHEQMKAGITGSFLLAKRQKFNQISQRLVSMDQAVLSGLVQRLSDGEHVRPETDAEKACFAVLEDLDHVGGHVKGSLTSKKYMRHELWSLISFLGAPSWFITLSPADNRHPICLYFADSGETFRPELRTSADRNRLIANNPVAAARFFDLMVRSFIKNVLGVDHNCPGLYGKTSGYYGTVEQQGRLTLHLHMLLWLAGAPSPQEIRDRLVSKDSIFQQELVQYLEGVHQGEFLTGSLDSVRKSVPSQPESHGGIHAVLQTLPNLPSLNYKDPTQTLPMPAPLRCDEASTNCSCTKCKCNDSWWVDYRTTVDDILLKSNIHRCTTSSADRLSQTHASGSTHVASKTASSAKQGPKGCLDRDGICRARFPREIHDETTVDEIDGHVKIKKLEAYMNTFTPCLTYLMRCNTDVTSLSSGTSIKAIVSYISDYVTKPALKTHQVFSSMYDVFERNKIQLGTNVKTESDAGRRLILQIVNSLNAKMEIGSPMASMYLLGNPDHYTGHDFVCFWWKSYVAYLQQNNDKTKDTASNEDEKPSTEDKFDTVKIGHEEGVYIATTNIDDYKYRPDMYSYVSLYEWTQASLKRRATKKEMKKMQSSSPSKSIYRRFKEGHPMLATHVVKYDIDQLDCVVPNIVGGALPRHDSGNREYYCCTMLTLFFPWREASCIKQPSETWESAFDAYRFSSRQRQLMRNFNLRYECLDARDDFHAQLKKKRNIRSPWQNGGDSDADSDTDFVKMPATGRIEHGVHGKLYVSSLRMMDSISTILKRAGWLQQCSDAVVNTYVRLCPKHIPGSSWSSIVKNRCVAIFKEKYASYVPPAENQNAMQGVYKTGPLVRLLTAEYFRRDFKAEKIETNRLIDDTVTRFSLNEGQERAFRIVANHASAPSIEQLKMYLGGMGGTGKSRVISALTFLFKQRKEDHRFIVLAPTGSAAALLNGSTYHKALGVNRKNDVGQDFSRNESAILNDVRNRLQGVEYVFIDEVSMIACHELYTISSRLAQITGVHDAPFGGLNVILAGDFAQLPPVFGSQLYDGLVERYVNSKMSVRNQETVIGKVLWHQITTVVILVENMRQKTQTEADGHLRTALENMRYAACTPEDIAFLRTLIAGRNDRSPRLSDPRFRNVSIITARNNQRDRINEEGSRRFAADHGVDLCHFYSLDELAGGNNPKNRQRGWKKRQRKVDVKKEPTLSGLTRVDQEALWECHPHMSDHIPAKLSLCVGMPVMIRNNEATELCVTKGQEAAVVGWDSSDGPYGHHTLDTLFVQLINPPKEVQLADLPMNVIPLTKTTTNIQCRARSDQSLQIKRQQIPILLNFAMTDYSSQGKTRSTNVVDLGYCRDHQSYYTALSRSSNAVGTALIQDFSEGKITGGISGWLRQEFRELNVLDEITRLRYDGLLPDNIVGPLRNPMVRAYYLWIKDSRDDIRWHSSIQYKPWEERIKPVESDATWDREMFHALRRVERTNGVALKRGAPDVDLTCAPAKIPRSNPTHDPSPLRGLVWDSKDYSCAYDSLYTILYNIWTDAQPVWSDRFNNLTEYLSTLSEGFNLVKNGRITLEEARDIVRKKLSCSDSRRFQTGAAFTCIATLTDTMMTKRNNRASGAVCQKCTSCGRKGQTLLRISECFQLKDTGPFQDGVYEKGYISDCLGWHLSEEQKKSQSTCDLCSVSSSHGHQMALDVSMNRLPYIMCITLNKDCFKINETLNYCHDMFDVIYKLRGIIYGDGSHFVARLIAGDGRIWYHDGIATRSGCVFEGNLSHIPDTEWLVTASKGLSCRKAVVVVYARE